MYTITEQVAYTQSNAPLTNSYCISPYLSQYRHPHLLQQRTFMQVHQWHHNMCPGIPMVFNISHEKSGSSGRSGDVIRRGCVSLPTCPRNLLHVQKLQAACTVNGIEAQCTSQGIWIERTINKTTRIEFGINVAEESLDSNLQLVVCYTGQRFQICRSSTSKVIVSNSKTIGFIMDSCIKGKINRQTHKLFQTSI